MTNIKSINNFKNSEKRDEIASHKMCFMKQNHLAKPKDRYSVFSIFFANKRFLQDFKKLLFWISPRYSFQSRQPVTG